MIIIKNKLAISKMQEAGKRLASLFLALPSVVRVGVTTQMIDDWIAGKLQECQMVSKTKGYCGYKHVSCISINDEVVHGVPTKKRVLKDGDLAKIDICASYDGYCADMARPFFVGESSSVQVVKLVEVAKQALDNGITQATVNNRLYDISAAIQAEIEKHGFGVVRDFAGHGIGKSMHEQPTVPNYGVLGKGIRLQHGMALAIEPMITAGSYQVRIDKSDGWTVRTVDGQLAAHVEDTVIILDDGPCITTRIV